MNWLRLKSFVIFIVVLIIGVATIYADDKINIPEIKKSLAPLNFSKNTVYPVPIQKYFKYYGLEHKNVRHVFGTFVAGNETLAAHFFVPDKYRATVIFVHGYLDHAGIFKSVVQNLVSHNYAVAVYDLPGYGLSSGKPSYINDFSEYADGLDELIKICQKNLHGPYHIIGFSMGAAVTIEYISTHKATYIDKIVLAAPLVRSELWDLSKFGYLLLGDILPTVPRVFRNDSSDKSYLKFVRNDPLQTRTISLSWVKALYNWNKRIENYPPNSKKMLILQGDKDCVVWWQHNIKFLAQKFPSAETVIIPQCNHQLFNESEPIKQKVFSILNAYLKKPD